MTNQAKRLNLQWILIGASAAVLFVLGISGFLRHAAWHNQPLTLLDSIYLTLQLIPLNSGALASPVPVELEFARFLFPLLAAITAIQAVFQIFHSELRRLRLRWLKNHIVICGLSRKGFLLASKLRHAGEDVVIIEQDDENKWLTSCDEQDIFVLLGDASSPALLRRAGIRHARALVAVVEDDGVNAEIMVTAHSLMNEQNGHPLVCLAHIADPQLCALLREREDSLEHTRFQISLFNVFEVGARGMVNQHPAWVEGQVAHGDIPRILIVGLGRMGENVILQLARNWWNQQTDKDRRLHVTLLDRDALARAESLHTRHPQLSRACDLEILEMDVHSADFERAAFLKDKRSKLRIRQVYICLDDDSLGLHAALTLLRHVPDGRLPIVVRMTEDNGLAHLLGDRHDGAARYTNLSAFTYLDHVCQPNLLTDTPRDILARANHEEYIQDNIQKGLLAKDDPSMQPWEVLHEQFRQTNYLWVDHISSLLKSVGYRIVPLEDWDAPSHAFTVEEIEKMARGEHDQWMHDRLAQGWRYAPGAKNLRQRTNPLLIPWEQLAEKDQATNRSMVRRIPAFLGKAGYQVKKPEQDDEQKPLLPS